MSEDMEFHNLLVPSRWLDAVRPETKLRKHSICIKTHPLAAPPCPLNNHHPSTQQYPPPSHPSSTMPPKGSTKLAPPRLPPLPKLRVRRPNKPETNPCLALMTSVLSTPGPPPIPSLPAEPINKSRCR